MYGGAFNFNEPYEELDQRIQTCGCHAALRVDRSRWRIAAGKTNAALSCMACFVQWWMADENPMVEAFDLLTGNTGLSFPCDDISEEQVQQARDEIMGGTNMCENARYNYSNGVWPLKMKNDF